MRFILVVTLVVMGAAACSDKGDGRTASTQRPSTEEAPLCEEWLIRPVTAEEAPWGCVVTTDSPVLSEIQSGMAVIECDDGRTLFFGEQGWGYGGEPMRTPNADALGSAQDACPIPEAPPELQPPSSG